MIDKVLTTIFGSKHERDVKKMIPIVQKINALEPEISILSDDGLRAKTAEFRDRLRPAVEAVDAAKREIPRDELTLKAAKEDLQAALDDILPEAFAVCREAGKRVLNMRHFDVQLMGGIVLHRGKISEMKTGEGKTLVATLPVYLNALTGRGVHVVTVNDYLARRDSEWMGRLYKFLGLTVGVIQNQHGDRERQVAYRCDVTYGTNNEYGFDYLRDNMKFDLEQMVQRDHVFAIVDEVDSILIDEARTPLIISGPSEESVDKYYVADRMIPKLLPETDFQVDEKQHTAVLTEDGVLHAEKLLGGIELYDPANMDMLHAVQQAVRAHALYKNDVEYVVKDGEVIIVDEFTGRLMPGRRWSDGLHQAVEAKEGVKIESENQTLATITFQNYFRMYEKLAGMTGTADTEAAEFDKIYKLEVVVIPPNRPMIRKDMADLVYRTEREKFEAIVAEVKERHELGQPALVGTISIEKSEALSSALKRSGVPHVVLNAKYHEREAEIVAQAGRKGAVTIATNMAGRGTDILLGGNPEFESAKKTKDIADIEQRKAIEQDIHSQWKYDHEEVVSLGGLHIIGTERHESRRIDNQLRGRSGRQGDPGSSRFYLSLEDDLMRIFGSDRISGLMQRLGMEEGVPIEHGMVTRAIERAQKQVEGRNFEARKHLLEYDDVMNKQRESVYTLRRSILEGREGKEYILNAADDIVDFIVDTHVPDDGREHPDEAELNAELFDYFGITLESAGVDVNAMRKEEVKERLREAVNERYEQKEKAVGPEVMRLHERYLLLQVIDQQWKDHLLMLDHLKEGIGLRGYGQRDPLIEYKKESFDLFQEMMERVQDRVVKYLWKMDVVVEREGESRTGGRDSETARIERMLPQAPKQQLTFSGAPKEAPSPVKRQQGKVGRNDPCPCGSGKKYKKCHGTAA
ncbi:MAG TPA: preprotein translocase subunit SecA [Thermoanaerobaculia bacterium]|nr:preprotein translocase subunit SecA [Thermoanaerobaculia bacterium]